MAKLEPGLAFSLPSDAGHIVGQYTHDVDRTGSLVWIAEPTFDDEPTLAEASQIRTWRWPILLPLGAAIHRRIAYPIGVIPIDPAIAAFPTLRSGNRQAGWTAFTEVDGVRHLLGPTQDRHLPIYRVVNDTRLKEMVVSGWRPEDVW